jgi:hypothetical protein
MEILPQWHPILINIHGEYISVPLYVSSNQIYYILIDCNQTSFC